MLGIALLGATSCDDFLTIYPQDRVVEENFWEDKNDLEGVRYGAYQQMASTVHKLIVWGDVRSDAYYLNQDYHSQGDYYTYKKIMLAELDSTMGFYDWGSVYTTINFCNKVLANGELVLSRDAQFTRTEWNQMKAEVTALRALNYFYLLRSFKDIPYSKEVINSDEETHPFTATPQMEVLDSLIDDVKAVAGQAHNRFGGSNGTADTKGLMTNTAIYALLCDMYLWRSALLEGRGVSADSVKADAQAAIDAGMKSIEYLALQTEQTVNSQFDRLRVEKDDFGSGISNAQLIQNKDAQGDFNGMGSVTVDSYQRIFASGNSDESIFELQFNTSDQRKNTAVNTMFGHTDATILCASADAMENALNNNKTNIAQDTRLWYSCTKRTAATGDKEELSHPYMLKWNDCSFTSDGSKVRTRHSESEYRNWIVYRLTDVMLMIAEAKAVVGAYRECRDIVDAVHKRSLLDQETGLSNNENTAQKCIDLVMKERLLELCGEGKRWFDLVRYAERIGGGRNADPFQPQYMDGADGVKKMVENWLGKGAYNRQQAVLENRIKNRYGLYSPVYYMELRANQYLFPQNPVWNREKGIPE